MKGPARGRRFLTGQPGRKGAPSSKCRVDQGSRRSPGQTANTSLPAFAADSATRPKKESVATILRSVPVPLRGRTSRMSTIAADIGSDPPSRRRSPSYRHDNHRHGIARLRGVRLVHSYATHFGVAVSAYDPLPRASHGLDDAAMLCRGLDGLRPPDVPVCPTFAFAKLQMITRACPTRRRRPAVVCPSRHPGCGRRSALRRRTRSGLLR